MLILLLVSGWISTYNWEDQNKMLLYLYIRGEVEDTRLEAKAKDTQKNPRPRTAFPRTEPLEAKDRNAQGQGPRTQAQAFSKKKGLQKFF